MSISVIPLVVMLLRLTSLSQPSGAGGGEGDEDEVRIHIKEIDQALATRKVVGTLKVSSKRYEGEEGCWLLLIARGCCV